MPSSFKVEKRGGEHHAVPCRPPSLTFSLASISQHHLVLEHLHRTRMMTMHGQDSRAHGIGQESRVQNVASARQARGERALAAPVRRALDHLRPSPASLALERAPPPSPLSPRHTRTTVAALSPSSSSESCRGYCRDHRMRPSPPVTFSLCPLHLGHRQDDAYT